METNPIDIEKVLCPQKNKLVVQGCSIFTTIVDAELDPLDCEFTNGGSVIINTENLAYIDLSYQNLYDLIDLIESAEEMYKKPFKK
jgi:hypothetical protein